MNMLKILKFDPQAFFRTVDKSAGDVLLHLADGSQHDLKLNSPIRLLLQSMPPGREGLTITLSNPTDIPAFMSYLAGV